MSQNNEKITCINCGGTGTTYGYNGDKIPCDVCGGSGEIYKDGCPRCGYKDWSEERQAYGAIKRICNNCGYWDLIG